MKIGELLNPFAGLNQMNSSLRDAKKLTEQIATGNRLTSASVDPSALAISERMKAQIAGLTKQAENISMEVQRDQTADAAYGGVTEYLQRISELTVQAQSGILTGEDKAIIQQEIDQLVQGIDEIAGSTQFNNTNILPSDLSARLGLDSISVANPEQAAETVSRAIDQVSSMRSNIGARINANTARANVLEQTVNNTVTARSALADTDIAQAVSKLSGVMQTMQTAIYGIQQKNSISSTVMSGILGIDKYA